MSSLDFIDLDIEAFNKYVEELVNGESKWNKKCTTR